MERLRAIPTAPTLVLAGLLAGSAPAFAQGDPPAAPASPVPEAAVLPSASVPSPGSPGLDVTQPSPTEKSGSKPIVKQWWFWTALGAAVATSIVILVLADRGPSTPNTTLGNQEFQP
jgi:hypothetical protein